MDTQNSHIWKEIHFLKPSFLVSMLDFGGVNHWNLGTTLITKGFHVFFIRCKESHSSALLSATIRKFLCRPHRSMNEDWFWSHPWCSSLQRTLHVKLSQDQRSSLRRCPRHWFFFKANQLKVMVQQSRFIGLTMKVERLNHAQIWYAEHTCLLVFFVQFKFKGFVDGRQKFGKAVDRYS